MVVFNFVIVAMYIVNVSILLVNMPKISGHELCKGGAVRKGDITYTLARKAWMLYLLKYVELFDTVFFVLRKKGNQITFLHVLHHSLIPIFGWVVFRTEKSALQSVPMFVNSFVHVIMYTYYGLAAMGPHVRKYLWWKKYLTQLQIVQFIFVIAFVTIIAPLSGCVMAGFSYVIDAFIGPVFLYLFYRYYKTTFLTREKSMKGNGVSEKDLVQNGSTGKKIVTNGNVTNGNVINHKVSSIEDCKRNK